MSRGDPEPHRADEFPERGAGVRAGGLSPSPVEREQVAEGRMRAEALARLRVVGKNRSRCAARWETRTGTVLEPAAGDGLRYISGVRKKEAGRELDGGTSDEFPEQPQNPVPDLEFRRSALKRLELA